MVLMAQNPVSAGTLNADPRLMALEAEGKPALLLSLDGRDVLWSTASGAAVLGLEDHAPVSLSAAHPLTKQVSSFAYQLAPGSGPRLMRLRLPSLGLRGAVTCQVVRIAAESGERAVLIVMLDAPAALLRPVKKAVAAPVLEAPADVEEAPAAEEITIAPAEEPVAEELPRFDVAIVEELMVTAHDAAPAADAEEIPAEETSEVLEIVAEMEPAVEAVSAVEMAHEVDASEEATSEEEVEAPAPVIAAPVETGPAPHVEDEELEDGEDEDETVLEDESSEEDAEDLDEDEDDDIEAETAAEDDDEDEEYEDGEAEDAEALTEAAVLPEPVPVPVAAEPQPQPQPESEDEEIAAEAEEETGGEEEAEEDAEEETASATVTPIRLPLRFVWQSNESGQIVLISPEIANTVGLSPSDIVGQTWSGLAERYGLSGGERLTRALDHHDTWSGVVVDWPMGGDMALPVELAGLPVFDRERRFRGFRGFGVVREAPRPMEKKLATAAPVEHAEPEDEPEAWAIPLADEMNSPAPALDERVALSPELPASTVVTFPERAAPRALVNEVRPPLNTSERTAFREIARALGASIAEAEVRHAEEEEEAAAPAAVAEEPEVQAEPEIEEAEAAAAPAATEESVEEEDASSEDEAEVEAAPQTVETAEETAAEPIEAVVETPAVVALDVEAEAEQEDAEEQPSDEAPVLADATEAEEPQPVAEATAEAETETETEAEAEISEDSAAEEPSEEAPVAAEPEETVEAVAEEEPAAGESEAEDEPAPTPPALDAVPALLPQKFPLLASLDTHQVEEDEEELDAEPLPPVNVQPLLDAMPSAVLMHRLGAPLYANRAFFKLTGFEDLGHVAQVGVDHLFVDEDVPVNPDAPVAPREGLTLRRADDSTVNVQVQLRPIEWEGEPTSLLLMTPVIAPKTTPAPVLAESADQQERPAASAVVPVTPSSTPHPAELRERELRSILDTATDGVIVLDANGRILNVNRSAEALFGYDAVELEGRSFTLLLSAESHRAALDYLDGLKANGVASVLNDGREVIGAVRRGGAIPLFMTLGQVSESKELKFCAVLRDITQFKKAEEELRAAKFQAERASSQKSDFLARVSHEVRTPLNAILGFAEVMMEERFGPLGNERYKDYLKDIHASGNHVISLVNDLLDLSKIEAGKLDLNFTSVNLNEVVSGSVALLQPQANRSRIIIRTSLAPKLPPVVADLRSLKQIVLNVLSNAVKFTPAGGQVIVSTALTDLGQAVIRVRDTGVGMNEKEIATALEPFRQLATSSRETGTGLGLPLTKALVEANRATFAIQSALNNGTLVEVIFPPTRVLAE